MLPFGNIFLGDCNMEIKRIRDLREDHDKTQKDIAEVLNMHRSVYRRYESGQRETPAWVVVKLADYYKVSTDYLLGRTDDPTPPKSK
jgi:transcriptional regulator with XRE-family HTH domain